MGEAIAFLSLLMFSFNVIITKLAGSRLDVNVGFLISISVNVLFSGLLLGIFWLINGMPSGFHWFGFCMFVISGVFASYLGRSIYFTTIIRLGPSKASVFAVSSPLFTALIAWIFLGESLSAPEFAAVFIILLGLFLISYIPQTSVKRVSMSGYFQPGVHLALFGSIAYALGNITRGMGIQDWNEPVLGGFLGAVAGLILQLLLNKQARKLFSFLRGADPKGVRLYAIGGILTISAQIAQIAAMHYMPISIATLITMSQPLLVIPLSYMLFKNQDGMNVRIVSGSLLVLLGIGTILLY
jgi:drug/metabolite transporter (DMT)-like permease